MTLRSFPLARRGRAFGAVAGIAGLVLILLHVTGADAAVAEWNYLVVIGGAGVAAALGARRPGSGPVVALIALGVCLSASADIAWQVYVSWRGFEPDVSVADIGWLGS